MIEGKGARTTRIHVFVAAAATAFSTGCFKWQQTGIAEAPIAAKERIPVTCIEDRSGRDAELVEGDVGGKGAVAANEVRTGFAPTLAEPIAVNGIQVYAGQKCVMLGKPVCDSALYIKRGDRRYFLYWGDQYEDASRVPASTQALVDDFTKRGLVAALGSLDVDDDTMKEFIALSQARRARQRWNLVKFVVGASLHAAAPSLGEAEGIAKSKGDSMMKESVDVRFEIDDSEKPALEKNARLAAMFAAAKLAAGGSDYKIASFCVGPTAAR